MWLFSRSGEPYLHTWTGALCLSARAAVTDHHRLGWCLLGPRPGGWKVNVLMGLASEASLCSVEAAALLLCCCGLFTPWCLCVSHFLLHGHQSDWIRATLKTPFDLDRLFHDLVSKCSHLHKYWGWGLRHVGFGIFALDRCTDWPILLKLNLGHKDLIHDGM